MIRCAICHKQAPEGGYIGYAVACGPCYNKYALGASSPTVSGVHALLVEMDKALQEPTEPYKARIAELEAKLKESNAQLAISRRSVAELRLDSVRPAPFIGPHLPASSWCPVNGTNACRHEGVCSGMVCHDQELQRR